MLGLLELDKAQLARIEDAIAALAAQSPGERSRKMYLLHALECEKQELIRANPAIRAALRQHAA